jgi:uncharacterized protein (DUF433 family)
MEVQNILLDQKIIHADPEIMGGKPVFPGTRVPLQTCLDYLEGEEGLTDFVADFPRLTAQAIQVLAAIAKSTF